MDLSKIAALAAKAATISNQTEAKVGGGDYTPPAAGACKLRFVGYVEIGKHESSYKGVVSQKDKVQMIFEVSGKNHPPTEVDGVKNPIRITIEETLSISDKARFFKLFQRMNYAGKATHMSQLLGEAFIGTIIHRTYKRTDGTEGVAVQLYDDTTKSYTIEPPRVPVRDEEGMATGKFNKVAVDAPITPIKLFLWDLADMEQWATLFIDGEYPERKNAAGVVVAPAKSKNVLQNKIKSALNFNGSPIDILLKSGGKGIDVPDTDEEYVDDDTDALNGIV